ncbi:MAG TPA: glycosyltransferase family 9 protein [Solirubrobacteraceae bacterium]|nr:glycosyltransferase family 9 protein [Solirubrobacteraceae bacterium]
MRPHVLVARQDNDGDVLLAGPAIRAIAAGASEVTLLCGPRGAQAASLLPGVDRILVEEAAWIDAQPAPVRRPAVDAFVDRLAALRADVAVILTSFHQSPLPLALLLRMAGIPRTGAISVDYPGSLLDVRHAVDDDVHEVHRALSLAAAMGFVLPAGDDGALAVHAQRAEAPFGGAPYVVVHPGASVPARAWAPERHRELVAALADAGRNVAVTGAPAERLLTALAAGRTRPGVRDLGGCTTLGELAGVLAGADAVIVGNTGPAHLAAAVGTPVVSLFAPTVPAVRWRPWGVRHELLHVDVPCAGCRARACPVPGHPCLAGVGVGRVLAALARLAPTPVLEAVAS